MPNGTTYQCTCIQTLGGVRFTNVIYLNQTTSDPAVTDPRKAVADALKVAYFDALAPLISDKWNLLCIEVKDISLTGIAPWQETYTLPGTDVAEALPAQLAALLVYNTTDGGRGRTAKIYVSGATVTDERDNNLEKTFSDALSAVGLALTVSIPNAGEGTAYRCGVFPKGGVAFAPFVIHDIRQPYTRVKSRRADTSC